MLDLGDILDGGIFLRLMLCTWMDIMLVLCWCLANLSRHGEVNHSSLVVPVETHSVETFYFPIYRYLTVCFECFLQVSGMFNALTFMPKLLNKQTRCNGTPLVTPEAWSVLEGLVYKFIKYLD